MCQNSGPLLPNLVFIWVCVTANPVCAVRVTDVVFAHCLPGCFSCSVYGDWKESDGFCASCSAQRDVDPRSASDIIRLALVCPDACLRSLSSARPRLIIYFWQLVEHSFHGVVISFRSPSTWHDGGHSAELSIEIWGRIGVGFHLKRIY